MSLRFSLKNEKKNEKRQAFDGLLIAFDSDLPAFDSARAAQGATGTVPPNEKALRPRMDVVQILW